jgi:MFS superfamily sulfate permease-like transporter
LVDVLERGPKRPTLGGVLAAIFGGASLQVTGPAAALNVMVLAIVTEFGPAAAAALGAGLIAIVLGIFQAGKLVRFVPESVLAGFTTGVGMKLIDQQLPEILGFDYKVTELAAMLHRPTWLHEVSWIAVVCGLFVSLLILSLRQYRKVPAALLGITVVTALSVYLGWDIERIGEIHAEFPNFRFPNIPEDQWITIITKILPIGLLGAAESLLSAQALDRAQQTKKPHNPNLELLGHIRLIDIKEFTHLLSTNKMEALAFVVTGVGTVSGHLVWGLAAGLAIALLSQWNRQRGQTNQAEKAAQVREGIRAVVGQSTNNARRPSHYQAAPNSAQWLSHVTAAQHRPKSTFIHPDATVIGRVVLGENVHNHYMNNDSKCRGE